MSVDRWRTELAAAGAIAAGSALGGTSRVAIAMLLPHAPWLATALVNVTGAFLIGLLHALTLPGGRLPLGVRWRQAMLGGYLGGFTTFSILSAETLALIDAGQLGAATTNLAGGLTLALLAVTLGHALGARWKAA